MERERRSYDHADQTDITHGVKKLRLAADSADAVVIGGGAGLSAAAGYEYGGSRFQKYFGDFIVRYHFRDMYTGGFYPFESLEEHWAYWSRYVFINRYQDAPKPVYRELYDIVKDREYFVITTNVDHCFQRAGFDEERIFYTQGDFGQWQCSVPCCGKIYQNERQIRAMFERQEEMRIPSELVPYCPECGAPMPMNLRVDDSFVEGRGWQQAGNRYEKLLEKHKKDQVLLLELGCGMNTPGIIKFPFWKLTARYERFTYACVNKGGAWAPEEITGRSICLDADIADVAAEMSGKGGLGYETSKYDS